MKRSIPVWFPGLAQREFEVERAHRIYGGNKAGGRDRPRVFIFKLLRYTDRQVILQENRKAGPVRSASGSILSFFPDFSPMTANMRNAFSGVRKSLRAAGVPNFLLYPAVLKVLHNGSQHLLQSPQEAEAFLHDKITSPHRIDQRDSLLGIIFLSSNYRIFFLLLFVFVVLFFLFLFFSLCLQHWVSY